MIHLNVQIIENKGRKQFAVLPYDQFLKIQEELEDYEDLRCLEEAMQTEKNAKPITMDELKKRLAKKRTRSS